MIQKVNSHIISTYEYNYSKNGFQGRKCFFRDGSPTGRPFEIQNVLKTSKSSQIQHFLKFFQISQKMRSHMYLGKWLLFQNHVACCYTFYWRMLQCEVQFWNYFNNHLFGQILLCMLRNIYYAYCGCYVILIGVNFQTCISLEESIVTQNWQKL